VIPTDSMFESWFGFSETDPFSESFDNMGYGTKNFCENLGTLFVVVMVGVLIIVLIACCGIFKSCHKKIARKY